MNIAIVLAGGTGTRVGAAIPKQFIDVLGKPILAYTLENLNDNPEIDAIEVVCHKDWVDTIRTMVKNLSVCHNLCLALYHLCGWGYTVLWFRSVIIYAQCYTILWFKLIKLDGQEKISILANLTLGHFCF